MSHHQAGQRYCLILTEFDFMRSECLFSAVRWQTCPRQERLDWDADLQQGVDERTFLCYGLLSLN